MTYRGQHLRACTVDLSGSGLCVKIFDGAPLSAGDEVQVTLDERNVHAKVVWSTDDDARSSLLAGLKIVDAP